MKYLVTLTLLFGIFSPVYAQTDRAVLEQIKAIIDAQLLQVTTTPTGTVIRVSNRNITTLRAAISAAQSRTQATTIILQPGAHVGRLLLGCGHSHMITLSADPSILPPRGTQISRAYDGKLPLLVSDDGTTPLDIQCGNYSFRGIQVRAPHVGRSHINVGSDTTNASTLPRNVHFEQMLIRGDSQTGGHRGVAMNGINVTVVDSWCDRMWEIGRDSQCFSAWNTPGPLRIENNYTEASGENIMMGGARAAIGVPPADVVIRKNVMTKDPVWRMADARWPGTRPSVKNLLELKFVKRATITENILHRHWQFAQAGWAVVFTTKSNIDAPAPYAIIEDVIFERNLISDVASGINLAAIEGPLLRVRVRNNVWLRLNHVAWGGDEGRFVMVQGGHTYRTHDIDISHNTVVGMSGTAFAAVNGAVTRLRMTHNVVEEKAYGLHTPNGLGAIGLSNLYPDAVFTNNAIVAGGVRDIPWPAGNTLLPVGTNLLKSFNLTTYKFLVGSPVATVKTSDGAPVGAVW